MKVWCENAYNHYDAYSPNEMSLFFSPVPGKPLTIAVRMPLQDLKLHKAIVLPPVDTASLLSGKLCDKQECPCPVEGLTTFYPVQEYN